MPFHNGWLPREGFTSDAVGRFLKLTALNPAFILPLILLCRYTKRGSDLTANHPALVSQFWKLLYVGLARYASGYLDDGVLNNWTKDSYDWSKEIVLITGGAGGIGGEVVKLFAERNIKVVVLDVIPMTFEAPPHVHHYKCDITSLSGLSEVATRIRNEVGTPTIIINNAGVARGKTLLNSTERDIRFTFEVNTLAHYWIIKEFLPHIIAANHGMVVTVASLAAYLAVPDMVDYASSKAAALSFHEGLATELKARFNAPKVRTVVVNQGYTKTPLFAGYNPDSAFLMPALEPQTVAEAIVRQVLTGRSGQVIAPGAGVVSTWIRALPHWMQARTRNDGEKFMKGWKGRQVIDVEN